MACINSRMARSRVLAGFAFGALLMAAPIGWGEMSPAAAQQRVSVSAQVRSALAPFGAWHHNRRYGDVWMPASRRQIGVLTRSVIGSTPKPMDGTGWKTSTRRTGDGSPITMGAGTSTRMTAGSGSAATSGARGVDWRYGDRVIGWAPLAPEDAMDLVEERPEFWVFINGRDFAAPRVDLAMLPPREASMLFGNTALVNRPVELRDRHFAVNPGIPAAFVAAAYGRPLQAFEVRPRVLASTANVPGAMQIRAEDLRRGPGNQAGRSGTRVVLQPSGTLISPTAARSLPPPQTLARGEPGRLGTSPPLAARGSAPPTTTGRAPPQPSVRPDQPPRPGERREGLVSPGEQPRNAPPEHQATPNPPSATPPRGTPSAAANESLPSAGARRRSKVHRDRNGGLSAGPRLSGRRSGSTPAAPGAAAIGSCAQRQAAPAVPRSSVPPRRSRRVPPRLLLLPHVRRVLFGTTKRRRERRLFSFIVAWRKPRADAITHPFEDGRQQVLRQYQRPCHQMRCAPQSAYP